jgi:hypothetical protein
MFVLVADTQLSKQTAQTTLEVGEQDDLPELLKHH